jgi:hypothetical protein
MSVMSRSPLRQPVGIQHPLARETASREALDPQIEARFYSVDQVVAVAAVAAVELAFFQADHVQDANIGLIQKQGPTDLLAHLPSWNSSGPGADPND